MLVKPTTMMNKSGRAVKDVMLRWGLLPSQIVVVLDDVDLPLGTIRIRPKGGDGCHGGLRNVIHHVKNWFISKNKIRNRCDIGGY